MGKDVKELAVKVHFPTRIRNNFLTGREKLRMLPPSSRYQSRSFACRVPVTDADFIEGFKLRDSASTKVVLGWIGEAASRLHWTNSLSREDIVSQASLKLLEFVSDPNQPPISSPKGLVHFIVKCVAVDAVRYEKRVKAMKEKVKHEQPSNPDPLEIYLSGEEIEMFLRARASVDPMCRQLWDMLFIKRLTYREIAEKLHIAEGTLRVRLSRCREKGMEWIRKNT